MTVTVGWIDGGPVRGEFTHSVAQLCAFEAAHSRLATIARVQSGPLMAEGRNALVERFLAGGADWLLMVDSDMTFAVDAADEMRKTAEALDVQMVGGLAFGTNAEIGQFPTIYTDQGGMPATWLDYPQDSIVPVAATGAAFTLTHRDLFIEYRRNDPHPWFHRIEIPPSDDHPGGFLGEDISWCWYLRSKGVPIVVDTSIKAGHVKAAVIDDATYQRPT